jgi:hypothetical protein
MRWLEADPQIELHPAFVEVTPQVLSGSDRTVTAQILNGPVRVQNHIRDVGVGKPEMGICRNEGDLGFDIVTIYAEDPTGFVPTSSFPGSRDRIVRSMVLAVLPHFT